VPALLSGHLASALASVSLRTRRCCRATSRPRSLRSRCGPGA